MGDMFEAISSLASGRAQLLLRFLSKRRFPPAAAEKGGKITVHMFYFLFFCSSAFFRWVLGTSLLCKGENLVSRPDRQKIGGTERRPRPGPGPARTEVLQTFVGGRRCAGARVPHRVPGADGRMRGRARSSPQTGKGSNVIWGELGASRRVRRPSRGRSLDPGRKVPRPEHFGAEG